MKKSLRLLAALGLSALMIFALSACGDKTPVTPDPEDPAENGGQAGAAHYVIYSDNNFPPFEFLDESGSYVGVDMELLAAIAADQGFTYEMKNEGFDAAMGAVQSGNADGMIAGMTIKESRMDSFDFSDGYFEDGQIMVVAADSEIASLDDIHGKTVAAKMGTVSTEYVRSIQEEYNLTIVDYEDSLTMYAAVMQGSCDVCFEDRAVIGWAIQQDGLALKTVDSVNIEPNFYGFAVKKGENAELIAAFNQGLANVKASGEYDTILAKYGY